MMASFYPSSGYNYEKMGKYYARRNNDETYSIKKIMEKGDRYNLEDQFGGAELQKIVDF